MSLTGVATVFCVVDVKVSVAVGFGDKVTVVVQVGLGVSAVEDGGLEVLRLGVGVVVCAVLDILVEVSMKVGVGAGVTEVVRVGVGVSEGVDVGLEVP